MRIGLISGEYPPMRGGVGDYSACLAEALSKRGHQVFVLARPESSESRPHILIENSLSHWGMTSWGKIRRWVQHHALDVVNLQYQTAIYNMRGEMHFLPLALRDVPFITTFHDLLPPYLFPKAGRIRTGIVHLLARLSHASVVTNHEDALALNYLQNVRLIPIGSNISPLLPTELEREEARLRLGELPQERAFLVAHFGFLYPNRGVEYLLEAVAELIKRNVPIRLAMIGGREGGPANSDYVRQLDERIQALGIASRVIWTGFVSSEQVSRYLQSVDSVALPFLDGASYRRGSLVAGIQHGCAIVTTIPAVPIDTLQEGVTVRLVPVANSNAIADALESLYLRPMLRYTLQSNIKKQQTHFDWQHIASQFESLFSELKKHD